MNIKKVELWTNKCYPCHSKEYVPLHQWFLSLGLPLDKFESIRIPLKKEWLEFAQKMKEVNIEPPFVVIRVEDKDTEAFIYRYENFIKEIERRNRGETNQREGFRVGKRNPREQQGCLGEGKRDIRKD